MIEQAKMEALIVRIAKELLPVTGGEGIMVYCHAHRGDSVRCAAVSAGVQDPDINSLGEKIEAVMIEHYKDKGGDTELIRRT